MEIVVPGRLAKGNYAATPVIRNAAIQWWQQVERSVAFLTSAGIALLCSIFIALNDEVVIAISL